MTVNDSMHPFQPGVKVALVTRQGGILTEVQEAIVWIVCKNRNFILAGDSQQYRAYYSFYDKTWEGFMDGVIPGFFTKRVEMITDTLNMEIAKTKRIQRFKVMQVAFWQLRCPNDVTDAELNALQVVIDALDQRRTTT